MKGLLQLKDLPFLLTLLLTLGGWTFMKLSSTIASSPTIEYKLVLKSERKDTSVCYYRLINLTNDQKFSNLEFLVQLDPTDNGQFIAARMESVPPAAQYQDKPNQADFTCIYKIPNFNPKEEHHLWAAFVGNPRKQPFLSLSANEGHVIVLRKASLFTFMMRNEEYVYSFSFLIIVGLITSYFLILNKQNDKKPKPRVYY